MKLATMPVQRKRVKPHSHFKKVRKIQLIRPKPQKAIDEWESVT